MRAKTELERILLAHPAYRSARNARGPVKEREIQAVLDRISDRVCAKYDPMVLLAHNRIIYEESAPSYAANMEHEDVPDSLFTFMEKLHNNVFVLDLGCGAGRDAVFMALSEDALRKSFMGRIKDGRTALLRFGMPQKSFHVLGMDASANMLRAANTLAETCGWTPDEEGYSRVTFTKGDMHNLCASVVMENIFDGAWSSAALFMHTPESLIDGALSGVAHVLAPGGIFGVSYANNATGLPYNNLRYSRTGAIKYFSRPSPDRIAQSSERAGLQLIKESFSDLHMAGSVQKDFFVTQIFQKL